MFLREYSFILEKGTHREMGIDLIKRSEGHIPNGGSSRRGMGSGGVRWRGGGGGELGSVTKGEEGAGNEQGVGE